MKKTYFLDTNIVLDDPLAIYNFKEHDVVMSMTSIEELDNNKTRQDNVGYNCRQFIRELNILRDIGSIKDGVSLSPAASGTFKIVQLDEKENFWKSFPKEISNMDKNDNLIIATAFSLSKKQKNVIVVTNDIAMVCKCDAIGLQVQEYKRNKVVESPDQFYKGFVDVDVTDEEVAKLYDERYLEVNNKFTKNGKLYPNQFLVLHCEDGKTELAKYDADYNKIIPCSSFQKSVFGIRPKNAEQRMAMDLLMDDKLSLVSLVGAAGSGKTLCALSAGLELVVNQKKYEKIIILKSIEYVGKTTGFLPGTLEEKLTPFMASYFDNLSLLFRTDKSEKRSIKKSENSQSSYLNMMMEKGIIEMESIEYIRGRSFNIPSIIIIDEVQNLSKQIIKTCVSRIGNESKLICIGDLDQIDNPNLNKLNNGLSHLVESFKKESISGHITLSKSERSKLAELASKLL